MSFFQQAGMLAWVTKQTNDGGADGFVRHANGLILVQCKRHGRTNFIGRPAIQQLKGVIEENEAWRGYIVTTSKFTQNAIDSAASSDQVILIDIDLWLDGISRVLHWKEMRKCNRLSISRFHSWMK